MASSKKGDGFREDFSSMFDLGAPKQPAPKPTPKPAPKKQEKEEEAAKTVTIYYYTEEDKMYLRYRSKMLGMNTSEFLMKLIEEDKVVDVNDPLHEEFRREIGRLSTSVKMTEKERLRFTNAAIQNRLPETHYVGYLLKKNRMNDPEW